MNQPLDIFAEARALGVTLEQENGGWLAVLPSSSEGDELGFPASSEAEALDEVRAYRAIEDSSIYSFEYSEPQDSYIVKWGDATHIGRLLAPAFRDAQAAYAASISATPPEPEPASQPAPPKARKPRTPKATPGVPADAPEALKAAASEPRLVFKVPEALAPGLPPWEALPEAPSKASSTLTLIADILADVAEVLRKRGQSQ